MQTQEQAKADPREFDHIELIEMKDIFADSNFNCRGAIAPADVIDLAKDIMENGLQQPIIVQPFADATKRYKWRIVAGYRRHMAHIIAKKDTIRCIVMDNLTELDARKINLRENLIRKQLNVMQEAIALRPFFQAHFTENEIANEFQQSRGWVQVRVILLKLDPLIQQEAAAGFLTQENIRKIYALAPDKRIPAVKDIKERKLRGERAPVVKKEPKKQNPLERRKREQEEIVEMIEHVGKVVGMGMITRALAWSAGNISTLDFYRDFKDHCDQEGIAYEIPPEVEAALN